MTSLTDCDFLTVTVTEVIQEFKTLSGIGALGTYVLGIDCRDCDGTMKV